MLKVIVVSTESLSRVVAPWESNHIVIIYLGASVFTLITYQNEGNLSARNEEVTDRDFYQLICV